MTPERRERVKQLLEAALGLEPSAQAALLDSECEDDPGLRAEIRLLLAEIKVAGSGMEKPLGPSAFSISNDSIATPVSTTDAIATVARTQPTPAGMKLKDRYLVKAELGRGSFGHVYLAFDEQLHSRPIVVKVLQGQLCNDEWFRRKFSEEREALARIDHPGVVGVLDTGETPEGQPFLVLQFVDGATLRSAMASGAMNLRQISETVRQIGNALTAAHDRGVCHRDLKPENIMLQNLGHGEQIVKIIDFGIASLKESGARNQTEITQIAGSMPYMAPEQLMGKPAPSSDIYALGVIAYEMLTGARPFEALSPAHLYSLQQLGVNAKPLDLRPGLSKTAHDVLLKALRFDPKDRYASARDFGEDLARSLSDTKTPDQEVAGRQPAVLGSIQKVAESQETAPRPANWIIPRRHVVWICLALLTAALISVLFWRASPARSPILSLAVLPFVNLGGDSNWDYLSDGFTESMINSLAHIHGLTVMSRSAVFRFQQSKLDPIEYGRRLHVGTLLTGSIRPFSDRLEVSLELVDVATGRHLWGAHYRQPVEDLLTFQQRALDDVVNQLRSQLDPKEKPRVRRNYTTNIDAYRLYLKGRYEWNKRTLEGFDKAIDYFKEARDKDPAYALAYSGIADAYATQSGLRPPSQIFPPAREAANTALEIDDELAEAHASLGFIRVQYDWDWRGAEREFRRALELNPNYATAHSMYARLLEVLGRFPEAEVEMSKAQVLDPLSISIANGVAFEYYLARNYARAEKQFRNNVMLDPGSPVTKSFLAYTYLPQGRVVEAISQYEQILATDPKDFSTMADLVRAYALAKRWRDAAAMYERLKRAAEHEYVPNIQLAEASSALDLTNDAFAHLDRAYSERDWQLIFLKVEPLWDLLRSDARFHVLLQKMKLAD